jgi:hypothetical protein
MSVPAVTSSLPVVVAFPSVMLLMSLSVTASALMEQQQAESKIQLQ